MQKIEIIDYIRNTLAPIDKTQRFHRAMVAMACDLVYSQKMSQVNDIIMGDLDLFSKEYTAVTVTLDATKNLYSSAVPAAFIPIPGISSGIRHINTVQGLDLDFVPMTELELNYMGGSVTQLVDTTIGYWVQGEKIWYDESMTTDIANAGVRIILIPRFSAYANSDTILVPGCTDLDFITQVLQLLSPSAPVDLKSNNA